MKRLNEEARKLVEEKAHLIVGHLYKATEKGGVRCVELLIELAGGDVEAEEALLRRPLRSLAAVLAADEPWPGSVQEAKAETGFGGCEPE